MLPLVLIQAALEAITAILKANQWRLDHLDPEAAKAEALRDSAPLIFWNDTLQAMMKAFPKT